MDLPPHIAALARLIRASLREISQAIEDQTSANADAEKAAQEQQARPREVIVWLRTDDKFIVETHPKDDKAQATQNSIKWATWSAVFAATIYAGITACQLRVMQRSVELSRQSMETDQRAWVGSPLNSVKITQLDP